MKKPRRNHAAAFKTRIALEALNKVGEQVRIRPAAMGSFLLSGPSKSSTRATRLR